MLETSIPIRPTEWNAPKQTRQADYSIPGQSVGRVFVANQLLVNVLGVAAWDEAYEQTFAYRWKGKDTLTWGNPDEWVFINWLRNRIGVRQPSEESLGQEKNLRAVIDLARLVRLQSLYRFHDIDKVKRFLLEYPAIMPSLLDARAALRKFFGDTSISLEVVYDPEISNAKQLFAYIKTTLSPDRALEQLDKFDEAWYLKQAPEIGGILNFSLETV